MLAFIGSFLIYILSIFILFLVRFQRSLVTFNLCILLSQNWLEISLLMLDRIIILNISDLSLGILCINFLVVLFQVSARLNLGFDSADHPFSQLVLLIKKGGRVSIFFHELLVNLVVFNKLVIFVRLVCGVRWRFCNVYLLDNYTVVIMNWMLESLINFWTWT